MIEISTRISIHRRKPENKEAWRAAMEADKDILLKRKRNMEILLRIPSPEIYFRKEQPCNSSQ